MYSSCQRVPWRFSRGSETRGASVECDAVLFGVEVDYQNLPWIQRHRFFTLVGKATLMRVVVEANGVPDAAMKTPVAAFQSPFVVVAWAAPVEFPALRSDAPTPPAMR